MTRRSLALLAALLGLAACNAPAEPKILTADADRVSLTWDSEASNIDNVTEQAQQHCARFGRKASLLSNSPASKSGTFFTAVYDCVPA
jgi:ABC-type glycerol-3-phosphate transport system substrate-binding protein